MDCLAYEDITDANLQSCGGNRGIPISFSTKKTPKKQVNNAEITITTVKKVWFFTSFFTNTKYRLITAINKLAIWIMSMTSIGIIFNSFPFHIGRNIRKYSNGIANAIIALIFIAYVTLFAIPSPTKNNNSILHK